jgi:hypothetical protein
MKCRFRIPAAVALAALLALSVTPVASAAPRERVGVPERIVKIIKNLQKFFGVTTQENLPLPPRP